MNYFGMFFTFMLPGLILGAMAAVVFQGEKQKKSVSKGGKKRENLQSVRHDKLFVYDLLNDTRESAA